MTRTSPAQVAFSAGEISPLLHRRFDFQKYQSGMAACRGFLPLRQGGFTRAPGTIFRGYTKANAVARLVPFQFAADDAVVLEVTNLTARIWRYGALVEVAGSPYELATGYPEAALPLMQWLQSADVIYMADGTRPVQKFSRFALDNWTVAAAVFQRGPFRAQNLDKARTLQASGAPPSITLTANASFWTSAHVGSLISLAPTDYSAIPLWTGNVSMLTDARVRYGTRVYRLKAGMNVGVNPPTHEDGEYSYGPTGPVWIAESDELGVVRIVSITSPTVAVGTIEKAVPQACYDDPTYRWAEGAWSAIYGYPAALEFIEQRLAAAATQTEPTTVWYSTTGAFEDFEPGVEADSSFAYTLAGVSTVDRILWLSAGRAGLYIGALGREYSTRPSTTGEPFGPTTAVFTVDSSIGSRAVRPIAPEGQPIFIDRSGRRLFEIAYNFQNDANQAAELSLPSDHLGAAGFREIVWQATPNRIAWIRRADGTLAALVYDPQQEVYGWAVVPVAGGFVEAMAVTPDAAGETDVLTLVVRRTINGQTVRCVEELAANFGLLTGNEPIAEAVHSYCSSVFVPGSPTDTFSVPHLAGATVYAWTDGGEFGPIVVPGDGSVTLPQAVGRATIGLFDNTHFAETLDITAPAPDGSSMGRRKHIGPEVAIGVHRTAAGKVASVERNLGQAARIGKPIDVVPRAVAADLTVTYSGVARVPIAPGKAEEVALRFTPSGLAPMTITAVVPQIKEAGL